MLICNFGGDSSRGLVRDFVIFFTLIMYECDINLITPQRIGFSLNLLVKGFRCAYVGLVVQGGGGGGGRKNIA